MQAQLFTGAASDWNDFVRRQSGWTHCHLFEWRSVMEEVFGHDCPYLAVRNNSGELEGVLPLVRLRSLVFGHYLVSLPFVNYGGPLGSDAAVTALGDAAAALAEKHRVRLVELRSRHPLRLSWPASLRKVTALLDLPTGGATALCKTFDSKLRSQIRRPQKEGVTVRFGPDQVSAFFAVFSRHMRDLGTPPQSRRFFETLVASFPDSTWVGCAYLDDTPIAGGFAFQWADEIEMTWASSLNDYKRIAPNMLLYWAFMERAADAGLRVFNFGRCTPGSNTHRFKQQWGTRDEQLWWHQFPASDIAQSTPTPQSARYAWGPRIWRRLPTRLTTTLGPRIVRCIP